MADRLAVILSHIQKQDTSGGGGVQKSIEGVQLVYDLINQFHVPVQKLNHIMSFIIGDMVKGLEGDADSSFKMLPSFVYRGGRDVSGNFLALDLGGTNFRVMNVALEGGKLSAEPDQAKYEIPTELMQSHRTATDLFDFIADKVKTFITLKKLDPWHPLGFTFSFPVDQSDIDSGILVRWTKGFSTQGVEKQDVVELLRAAFKRKDVHATVSALVNDTVGTLVTGYFENQSSEIGVILGTGSNACYWEDVPQIKKLRSPPGWKGGEEKMCINIEWGNFDSIPSRWRDRVLPYTAMDLEMDAESLNPGQQRFEKMLSGMYLGELGRRVLLKLVEKGVLPSVPSHAGREWSFTSAMMSQVIADTTPDLVVARGVLRAAYNYELNADQMSTLRELFISITTRSARLAAAGVAAILLKTGNVRGARVCIDGSVFEKVPNYQRIMASCLDELLTYHGFSQHGVTLVHTGGGSGVGASLIAALVEGSKSK